MSQALHDDEGVLLCKSPCGVMLEVALDVGEFPLFTADQFLKLGPTAAPPLQAFLSFLQLGNPAQGPLQFRLRLFDVASI